jgi:hypothetical protein
VISFTQQFDSNGKQLEQPQQVSLDPVEILQVSTRMNPQTQEYTETIEWHWCSLIKGEKRYGVRLRGNGEIIKT